MDKLVTEKILFGKENVSFFINFLRNPVIYEKNVYPLKTVLISSSIFKRRLVFILFKTPLNGKSGQINLLRKVNQLRTIKEN